jgi:nucleotide-binding universal stress UspA family protein
VLLNRVLADLPAVAECESILRVGEPAKEILAAAHEWKADLIVIGTHGYGHFEQFVLGSVANAVMRGARCPVMAVRPDGLNIKPSSAGFARTRKPAAATTR